LEKSSTKTERSLSGQEAQIGLIMGDAVLRNGQTGASPDVLHESPILAYFVALEQAAEIRRDKWLIAEITIEVRVGAAEGKGGGARNLWDNAQVYWDRPFMKAVIESFKDLRSSKIANIVIAY